VFGGSRFARGREHVGGGNVGRHPDRFERVRQYGLGRPAPLAQREIEVEQHGIGIHFTPISVRRSKAFRPFRHVQAGPLRAHHMTRSVWLKADDSVGDWERRKKRITAGLEAGVDWVLCDEADVPRVRDLGAVSVAAFADNGGVDTFDEDEPDARVVGKEGEGDGTVDLPPDLSGSADLSTLRRDDADGAYVRVFNEDFESFAETAAEEAEYTIVVGEDWTII